MPRKVIVIEHAMTFSKVHYRTLAAQVAGLGEMVDRAKSKLGRTLRAESRKSKEYPAQRLHALTFWKGWKLAAYVFADARRVVCFSVAWFAPGKSVPLDPMQVIRRRLQGESLRSIAQDMSSLA